MSHPIEQLREVMARLRHPDEGCPWDRQQTFSTVAPYTIEEAYEVADAIARGEMDELCEELGDLLFQVVFHARIAEESGSFDLNEVIDTIIEKMIRRHPHVFADESIADSQAQSEAWERHKSEERAAKQNQMDNSLMAGVALGLPALLRAEKLQKRAARVGFDWQQATAIFDQLHEEIAELHEAIVSGEQDAVSDEMGDLLFTCVNLSRHLGIDPEAALRASNDKFSGRFQQMERVLAEQGGITEADMAQMDRAWRAVKAHG